MWSNLMMAIASSVVPGFGLLGSIVEFITSDDPDSGKKFFVELATSALPGGFLTNLGTSILTEALLGSQLEQATKQVTPYSDISHRCEHCDRPTNYYAIMGGRILCSRCVSNSLSYNLRCSDNVYILRNGIYQVHNELKSKVLIGNNLQGRTLRGRELG